MFKTSFAVIAIAASALSACSTMRPETGGFDLPAIAPKPKTSGGVVAAQIVASMEGGLIGGSLGGGLDDDDKRKGLEAEYRALEYTASGQAVSWRSDQPDRYGQVIAAQPYRVGSQDCRQYTHTVFLGGAPQSARGTACRNPDGSWTRLT